VIFPTTIWASNTNFSQKTINAYKSFHAKFNKIFALSHLNTYVFIDVLKQLQINTYILMQNTTTRPSTTWYKKTRNEIQKYITL